MDTLDATFAIQRVLTVAAGLPVYIAGSAVVAEHYDNIDSTSFDDVDVFCPTPQVLIALAERFINSGFILNDRMERVYTRWLKFGFKGWHTNSLKLELPLPNGVGGFDYLKINLVYKLTDGHPTTSLAQVLESFDFGLLALGYDAELNRKMDLRPYLFQGMDPDGPLPLMPNKQGNWRSGFISQYNGLRECGRYVKYHDYGFDLSLVKDDLVTGYRASSEYYTQRDDKDKVTLGLIYESLAESLENDELDKIREASGEILYMDSLDAIMEALE